MFNSEVVTHVKEQRALQVEMELITFHLEVAELEALRDKGIAQDNVGEMITTANKNIMVAEVRLAAIRAFNGTVTPET